MRKTEGTKGQGCNSKNGAVAENPLVRSIPPSSKCPKCGSEMWQGFETEFPHESRLEKYICPWCGHEETVGEKSCETCRFVGQWKSDVCWECKRGWAEPEDKEHPDNWQKIMDGEKR